MITETGRVVAVESDCLWVETIRRSTCGTCSARKGCGHGLLNKTDSKRLNHLRVLLDTSQQGVYQVGDEVKLSISEQILVHGALIVYIMPLLMLLLGAVLAENSWASDTAAFIGAVIGFVLGMVFVRIHAWVTRNNRKAQPQITGFVYSGS